MLTDPEGAMEGIDGNGLTVTTVGTDGMLWHPAAFVTCTVKVPAVLTVILLEVAPVDHRYPEDSVAVSTTSSPEQKVTGPSAVITGWGGLALTVSIAGFDVVLFTPLQLVI